MKKKIMISQPMAGKTGREILETRNRFLLYAERNDYEVINTLFADEWYTREQLEERGVVHIPLCFLAKSLENMANCDMAYFAMGWESARGCRIEHEVAVQYGVPIIEVVKEGSENGHNYEIMKTGHHGEPFLSNDCGDGSSDLHKIERREFDIDTAKKLCEEGYSLKEVAEKMNLSTK